MRKLVEDERRRPGIACTSESRIAVWALDKKRTTSELLAILNDTGYEEWLDEKDDDRKINVVTTGNPVEFNSMTYSIRVDGLLVPIEVVGQMRQMLRALITFATKGTQLRYEPPKARAIQHGNPPSDRFSFHYRLVCEEKKP